MPTVAMTLAPGGLFYLVCIAENDPVEILAIGESLGLSAQTARREQRGMEELWILRFQREQTPPTLCSEEKERAVHGTKHKTHLNFLMGLLNTTHSNSMPALTAGASRTYRSFDLLRFASM